MAEIPTFSTMPNVTEFDAPVIARLTMELAPSGVSRDPERRCAL